MNFLDRFSKKIKISNFMKINTVGDKLFYADGQTHMTKVKVALRNFAYAPNKQWFSVAKLHIKKTFQKVT